jgi:hypothetical protein
MLLDSLYDPEGTIALHAGKKKAGKRWICINDLCEIGKTNVGPTVVER